MDNIANQLRRFYLAYSGAFVVFVLVLGVLEQHGMPPRWIGYSFLFLTICLYATIGVMARTANVSEYYVAGRRVPAVFNGMATGADWMSAASFMGLAGTLYLSGYQGLAYVMGPICVVLANSPFPIFSVRAMAVTRRVWSACFRPSLLPLFMWWHRSTGSA
jgi:hypothetical protein